MSFAEALLDDPDLGLHRGGSTPWGDRRLVIARPGGPIVVAGLNGAQEAVVRQHYGRLFLAADAAPSPAAEIRVRRASGDEFRSIVSPQQAMAIDIEHLPSAVRVAGQQFIGRIAWQPRMSGAIWTSIEDGPDFQRVFENFFRAFAAYRSCELGGVVLHSAGVVAGQVAHLFYGPSGSGKSTLSRIGSDAGHEVLSDDLNALRRADGGSVVETIPFAGDLRGHALPLAGYPLRGVYRLRQGAAVAVAPQSRGMALASLLACAPYVNADRYRRPQLEVNLERLVASVPTGILTFPKNARYAEVLRCLEEVR